MKIIGHRGAAGLAPENTIQAITAARRSGAQMIEMDVRATKDGALVLSHDENTLREFGADKEIAACNLSELREACPNLPLLHEALKACGTTPPILEIKAEFDPELLFAVTDTYTSLGIVYASFNHQIVANIKKFRPAAFVYVLERHSPVEILSVAKTFHADGIGLLYPLLNPLTYLIARHKGLKIYVWTLNHVWLARLYHRFYPEIDICTDFPDKLQKSLPKKRR